MRIAARRCCSRASSVSGSSQRSGKPPPPLRLLRLRLRIASASDCAATTMSTSLRTSRKSIGSRWSRRISWSKAVARSKCSKASANDYPIVMHGVSMSIGSTDPLNRDYLRATASAARAALRAGVDFGSSVLDWSRRAQSARPAAAAVHRGGGAPRRRAHPRGAGFPRAADTHRERFQLHGVRGLDDDRVGISRRSPTKPTAEFCSTSTTSS